MVVDRSDSDLHVREFFMHGLYTFRSSYEGDLVDRVYAELSKQRNRRQRGTSSSQHRIKNIYPAFRRQRIREFCVIRNRLQGGFVPAQADVIDLGVRQQVLSGLGKN